MTNLSDFIAGVKTREAKATKGPWLDKPREFDDWGMIRAPETPEDPAYLVAQAYSGGVEFDRAAHRAARTDPTQHNADFIAHARTDVPTLVRLVEVLMPRVNLMHLEGCPLDSSLAKCEMCEDNQPIGVGSDAEGIYVACADCGKGLSDFTETECTCGFHEFHAAIAAALAEVNK